MSTSKPRKPSKPKTRGHKLRTYELTNIQRPVTHKMKPMRSGAVVHKKRGTSKKPKQPHERHIHWSAEQRSIAKAQQRMVRAARRAGGIRKARKIRTVKFTNIQTGRKAGSKSFKEPKKTPKSEIE